MDTPEWWERNDMPFLLGLMVGLGVAFVIIPFVLWCALFFGWIRGGWGH